MKRDILSMYPDELREFVVSELGEPKYRADQVWGFMYKGEDFDGMTNLPKKLRDALKEKAELRLPKIDLKFLLFNFFCSFCIIYQLCTIIFFYSFYLIHMI